MKVRKTVLLLLVVFAAGAVWPQFVSASPSDEFFQSGGHIYDEWGVFRTRIGGSDGFLAFTANGFDPIIVKESLGENADVAWKLGEEFRRKFPDSNQRAEQIFYFVRDRVRYTSDADQFGRGEFAQNADELAATIVAKGSARGDCEDTAVLLAVMYKAAGYRSALVLMPGHIALLVYMPEYRKASRKLTVGGESGWVWAEATGATNSFGWLPESLMKEGMIAREILTDQLPIENDGGGAVVVVEEETVYKANAATSSGKWLIALVGIVSMLWIGTGRRGGSSRVGGR